MFIKTLNIVLFISYMFSQNSLFEKEFLGKQYYDSGFFNDAIIIYEEIYAEQKNILGENNINLNETLLRLAELYYLINDLEPAKYYLQKHFNIQSKYVLKIQKNYNEPLHILKEIYVKEKNYKKIHTIDSLINVLSTNTDSLPNDSLLIFPKIIVNNNTSSNNETEYSINDLAIDLMKEGFIYYNNELYTEAIQCFLKALSYNATTMDLEYFISLDYSNNSKKNELYLAFNRVLEDSLYSNAYFYVGILDYQDNNYNKAINSLSKFTSNHPQDIRGLLALGKIYYEQTLWLDASFYYFRALKINPNNFDANVNLAKSLIKLNQFSDALDILQPLINIYPNNYEIYYNLGLCYFELHENELSIKNFTHAILLETNHSESYYALGLAYNNKKSFKQALEAFKGCLKLNPYNGMAHYQLGEIYQIVFESDLAIEHYIRAKKSIDSPILNYNLGMLYYNNQSYQLALDPIKKYLLQNMNDWATLSIFGNILTNTKRFPEAIDIYLRLIDEFPDTETYYHQLANAYYNLNDYNKALNNYKKILSFEEENYDILLKIGIILNNLNNFYQAEKYLIEAISCGHPNKEILIQLGMSYGGQKKFLQSLGAFKKALTFSLDDPIIHYQLAIIYKELNIYNLAIDEFNKYLINNYDDYIAYYLIGECYYFLEIYDISLEYFEKSYNINSSHTKSLYNMGSCNLKLNNNKQAAKIFKTIIKKSPNHVQSRYELVNLYLALNKRKEAKKECEIIFMLDRDVYNSIEYCINK